MPATRPRTTAMEPRQRMFATRRVVRRSHHMPVPIMGLIALEVVELLRPMLRHRPMIPMPRVIAIIYMPMEITRPMEPRPRADKDPARKPIRPIVPIGRAVIRSIVEVPIRTPRFHPNPNGNL